MLTVSSRAPRAGEGTSVATLFPAPQPSKQLESGRSRNIAHSARDRRLSPQMRIASSGPGGESRAGASAKRDDRHLESGRSRNVAHSAWDKRLSPQMRIASSGSGGENRADATAKRDDRHLESGGSRNVAHSRWDRRLSRQMRIMSSGPVARAALAGWPGVLHTCDLAGAASPEAEISADDGLAHLFRGSWRQMLEGNKRATVGRAGEETGFLNGLYPKDIRRNLEASEPGAAGAGRLTNSALCDTRDRRSWQ